jgi:hypothetical protein
MWWIRKRAKAIVPVLLILAVISGGVVLLTNKKGTSGNGGASGGSEAPTTTRAGESVDGAGVRVYKDADGRIVVSNGSNMKRELTLKLPQSCAETVEAIDAHIAEYKTAVDSSDDSRITMVIYQRLAQDLCSWREYNETASKQLSEWFQPAAGGTSPAGSQSSTVPPINQESSTTVETTTTTG